MAPINPNQILNAFEPVVSEHGGIKSIKEVAKLSGFLNNDGWQMINDWLKDSIEKQNPEFLLELIKVLDRCPVNTERLKLNDTPKLLKNLVKSENTELAAKAKILRSKWKVQVENEVQSEIDTSSLTKEKRKLKDSSNSNRDDDKLNNVKKLKTKDENVSLNSLSDHDEQIKKSADHSLNNDSKSTSIKTAKFKLGKMRSIGLLDKDTTKPSVINGTSSLSKGTKLVNSTASTPSPKLNVSCKNANANKGGIQLIDAQPLPETELMNNSSSHHQTKHIIKESASFMDALSSVPTTPKLKKKKKVEKASNDKSTSKTTKQEDQNELNQMDFDSGIGDLNNSNLNDRMTDENNSMESTTNEIDDKFLTFNNESPFDPTRNPTKGILLLVPKSTKRNIQWPEDDKLERVKFFETDEKERCNVYKQQQNFDQHRKDEAVKERALNVMNKNTLKTLNSPGICLIPWKLYPINFDGVERFLINGQNSVEKFEQSKRLRNVLEDIDLLFNRADPKEPDSDSNNGLTDNETKEIPLEDDNNMIVDFSNEVYSVNGVKPVVQASNVQLFGNLMNPQVTTIDPINNYTMNNVQFGNLNYNHQMINNSNLFNQQQHWNQNGSLLPPSQMMNQHMQTDPQWTTSNWNNVVNSANVNANVNNNPTPQVQVKQHNNYHGNKNGNNQHHKNSNFKKQIPSNQSKKQTPLCRFYQNEGCRNGTNCTFLHSK